MKPAREKGARGRWPGRLATTGATLLALAAIAVALASVSSARVGPSPTISGTAEVGQTLVASTSSLYRWQRCDPAVNTCVDAAANDNNWSDITGAREQTYTIVLADVGFFIRVITKGTNLGEQWAASAAFGPVPAPPPLPPGTIIPVPEQGLVPLHGVQVLAQPVEGTVKWKAPGQTAFNVLTELSLIPVGSTIDTRGSRVRLVAATGALGSDSADQPVDFYAGLFKILQKPGVNARAKAKLTQKLACKKKKGGKKASVSSGGPRAVESRRRKRRRLWGSGSGSYSTSGSGGTGSVRGTTWLTKDTCKGTKFKVTEGLGITVFDFKKKKKIKLGPGDTYFAAN